MIYGIGIGPGDAELITFKAARILRNINIIYYPEPKSGHSRAFKSAKEHIRADTKHIPIRYDMSSRNTNHDEIYENTALKIDKQVKQGLKVGILCEGDPLLYGSFIYLYEKIKHKPLVEIIPGISSISAGAAALKLPLAKKDEHLNIIPASANINEITNQLNNSKTTVILKVGNRLEKIMKLIKKQNLLDNSYFISDISSPNEVKKQLKECTFEDSKYFSVIYVIR